MRTLLYPNILYGTDDYAHHEGSNCQDTDVDTTWMITQYNLKTNAIWSKPANADREIEVPVYVFENIVNIFFFITWDTTTNDCWCITILPWSE